MSETIFTNARLILDDRVVRGSLVFAAGRIVAIDTGHTAVKGAVDLDGDYLAPGLIEMHTDNAEKHFEPRPDVMWPDALSAMLVHDAQLAAAGVTTVYDSVCAGYDSGKRRELFARQLGAVGQGIAAGAFRIEHRIHIRCELTGEDLMEVITPFAADPLVQLISLMDHTPGQRQWRDIDAMRRFHLGSGRMSLEEHERLVAERIAVGPSIRAKNLPRVLELFAPRGIVIASHDDTTAEDVADAKAAGAVISEFPTTVGAARAAKAAGLATIAGAPNVVRGGSHSGGVSVAQLAAEGVLDGLSSDYVPSSLLQAVLRLAGSDEARLPGAIALTTANIADALGLDDRGRLVTGLRADLVRFKALAVTPIVREVWCAGRRAI